jgi:AsmA-like protein
LLAALVVSAIAGTGAILLARHFPFTRERVSRSLEEAFQGKVTFARFHTNYLPHPGCVAEGVTLIHFAAKPGEPPFASAHKLTVRAAYLDFVLRPGFISRIVVEGLHIQIPARGVEASDKSRQSESDTKIGEVVANKALFEVSRQHGGPLQFVIHSSTLHSVSRKDAMEYDVAFTNAVPPGEIQSRGRFGPWNSNDPKETRVLGTYKFERANLGVFHGIEGTLSSHDNFQGTLGEIETYGTADIPDFKLQRAANRVEVHSRFHAFVNALNGDVRLEHVESTVMHTTVLARGSVAGRPGHHGKFTSLDLNVSEGRIQDVFRIFVSEPKPPFNGVTSFRAHVEIPPEGRPFLMEVKLRGDFGIDMGHFTKPNTQKEIATLSERARGKKPNDDDDPRRVISDLQGSVILEGGVARFKDLSFAMPGAFAQLHGTYNVINEKVNLHGTLKTDANFSQTAGGIKSIFLKPFDAMFKKKPKGAEIPIQLTGTYSDPHPGIELGGGKPAH